MDDSVLILIGIVACAAIIIWGFIRWQKIDEQYKADLKKIDERAEERERKRERIKNFYATHPETRSLSEKIDMEWSMLLRNSGTSLLDYNPLPKAPTYTQGLYKGSLGDNISQIANAQKKEQYERDMARYEENVNRKVEAKIRSQKAAIGLNKACEELIKILEKIPGSDEVIEDVKEKRDYASNYLKQNK